MCEAELCGADFSGCHMIDANLSKTDLDSARFFITYLSGADFSEATMLATAISQCDLSQAKGLDHVYFNEQANLDISSIFWSRGQIPETFLRGCGAPHVFVEYVRSLAATAKAIDFNSCFISHSSADETFARRLYSDLRTYGVSCWFAPEDMRIGSRIRPSIDQAIHLNEKLLLILSARSVVSSWVEKEVETAFEDERKSGRVILFPIRLDEAVMETSEAWAADIRRTRHIGDFCQWENRAAYDKALSLLLRDLKK